MARYTGINHLAMVTSDMDMTIRFWRDLLGLPMTVGLGGARYRHYFFSISEHDQIAFFQWDGAEPIPEKDHGMPVKGPVVFDHVSLAVAGGEDLWEIKDKLEAAGFWASEVVDHGFIHSLYSFDPNGMAIEFSAPVPGVDLRRHPRLTDNHPAQAALEGPEPQPGHWPEVTEPMSDEDKVVYPGEGDEFLHEKANKWPETR